MTRPGRPLTVLVFGLMAMSLPQVVDAECVGFSVDHYLKYADIVFLGTLREIKADDQSKQVVRVEASWVWKGAVQSDVVLYQAPWVAFDSFAFPNEAAGKQYLVFARRMTADQRRDFALSAHEDGFAIPACSGGTVALRDVRDAPRELGRGRAVQ